MTGERCNFLGCPRSNQLLHFPRQDNGTVHRMFILLAETKGEIKDEKENFFLTKDQEVTKLYHTRFTTTGECCWSMQRLSCWKTTSWFLPKQNHMESKWSTRTTGSHRHLSVLPRTVRKGIYYVSLTIISRKTWVYFLSQKSGALHQLLCFKRIYGRKGI